MNSRQAALQTSPVELQSSREALETAGATLLGRFIYEFARVDVNLGLCLVWIDGGAQIEALTKQVEGWNFAKRLECLKDAVDRKLRIDDAGRAAYTQWIERADSLRITRNELVHSRWGVNPTDGKVVNFLSFPTSDNDRAVGYSLKDLEGMLAEMRDLQAVLGNLRERWPL